MKNETMEKLQKRTLQNFLDVLVLARLKDGPLSGYDVIKLVHGKYDLLISPGTIYSLLYSLEREGLIHGTWDQRRRVYELSDKGKQNVEFFEKANGEVQDLLKKICLVTSANASPENREVPTTRE